MLVVELVRTSEMDAKLRGLSENVGPAFPENVPEREHVPDPELVFARRLLLASLLLFISDSNKAACGDTDDEYESGDINGFMAADKSVEDDFLISLPYKATAFPSPKKDAVRASCNAPELSPSAILALARRWYARALMAGK